MSKHQGFVGGRVAAIAIAGSLVASLGGCAEEGVGQAGEELAEVAQGVEEEAEFDIVSPVPPWVPPTMLVSGTFPGGVLNFTTPQQFVDFMLALDAANATTDGNGALGEHPYSATNTNSAQSNYKTFTIKMDAGQILDLGTCNAEGASATGDTYLRLYVGSSQVAYNDDACDSTASSLSYTATSAVTVQVRMGCYSSATCSGVVGYSLFTPNAGAGGSGARSFSGTSTASATTNVSTITLSLSQGQVLDLGTCGVSGASFSGDTYLRLWNMGHNADVAISDDACGGLGSRITYTVPQTAWYAVQIGCYSSNTCSGTVAYTITQPLTPAQMVPTGFSSAYGYQASRTEPADDLIYDVTYAEYLDDLKDHLVANDTLGQVLDNDLQVVIENKLYQLTNIGVFEVEMSAIPAYRAWLSANAYAINTDPAYTSVPGETALGDGRFQVMPGVVRSVGWFGVPTEKFLATESESCTECKLGEADFARDPAALGLDGRPLGEATAAPDPSDLARRRSNLSFQGTLTLPQVTYNELGRISYWWGKVNTRKPPGGVWTKDADCSSGASIAPLTYCKKFWPGTVAVFSVPVSAKSGAIWADAGCTAHHTGNGLQEWVCSSSTTQPPGASCQQTPPASMAFRNVSLGGSFNGNDNIAIPGTNRRLVFKARSLDVGKWTYAGFQFAQIKTKVERKKKFLFVTYWGRSQADELKLGIENLKVNTDIVGATTDIQAQNTSRPRFHGAIRYKLRNHTVDALSMSFNPAATSTGTVGGAWNNSAFNTLTFSGDYTNNWRPFENTLINWVDPGLPTRYPKHARYIAVFNTQNKLDFALTEAEVAKCNESRITWRLVSDFYGATKEKKNEAAPTAQPKYYKQQIKAAAFVARARVGSSWAGIRFVRQQ